MTAAAVQLGLSAFRGVAVADHDGELLVQLANNTIDTVRRRVQPDLHVLHGRSVDVGGQNGEVVGGEGQVQAGGGHGGFPPGRVRG